MLNQACLTRASSLHFMRFLLFVIASALTIIFGAEPLKLDPEGLAKLRGSDDPDLFIRYLEQACIQDDYEKFRHLSMMKPLPLGNPRFKALLRGLIRTDKHIFLYCLQYNELTPSLELNTLLEEITKEVLGHVKAAAPQAPVKALPRPVSVISQMKETVAAKDWGSFEEIVISETMPLDDPEFRALLMDLHRKGHDIALRLIASANSGTPRLPDMIRKVRAGQDVSIERFWVEPCHLLEELWRKGDEQAFLRLATQVKLNHEDPEVVVLLRRMILAEAHRALYHLVHGQVEQGNTALLAFITAEKRNPQPLSAVGEPKPVKVLPKEPVITEFSNIDYPDFKSAKVVATLASGVKLWTSADGEIRKYASLSQIPNKLADQIYLIKSDDGLNLVLAACNAHARIKFPKLIGFPGWSTKLAENNVGLNGVVLEYDVKTHKATLKKFGKMNATPLVLPLRKNNAGNADLIEESIDFFSKDSEKVEITILPGDLIMWIPIQFMETAGNNMTNIKGIVCEYDVEDPKGRLETFATIRSYIPGLKSLHAICFQ